MFLAKTPARPCLRPLQEDRVVEDNARVPVKAPVEAGNRKKAGGVGLEGAGLSSSVITSPPMFLPKTPARPCLKPLQEDRVAENSARGLA